MFRVVLLLVAALVLVEPLVGKSITQGTAVKRHKQAKNKILSPVTSSGAVEAEMLGKSHKALDYKLFDQWNPPRLSAGDCRSKVPPPNLELTLYSDGSLHWVAQVFSLDTHDTWSGRFIFKSSDSHIQGVSGPWFYRMTLSTPRIYIWDLNTGTNATLAANFNLITQVVFEYDC